MVWAKFGHPSQNLLFHIYGNVKITKNGRGNHPRCDMFTLKSSEREKITFSSLSSTVSHVQNISNPSRMHRIKDFNIK